MENRELKFRAWCEVDMIKSSCTDQMVYFEPMECDNGLWFNSPDNVYHINEYHSIMQFTGLTDKNGKEIYEGDILDYTVFDMNDNDTQFRGVVNWFGSGFIVTQIPDKLHNGEYGLELDWVHGQDEELEIIGNIHQNKELTQ